MMRLVFATGRLLELYKWIIGLCMSASDLEMVSYARPCVVKASAEAALWQIREVLEHRYAANNIWSIAFEARTKEILQEVC